MSPRRAGELAFLLPWVGAFLLTPPVLIILRTWSKAAGFPLFVLYIFACWLALIVAGALVARRLPWAGGAAGRDEGPPPDAAG
jgi:hypothetical protein